MRVSCCGVWVAGEELWVELRARVRTYSFREAGAVADSEAADSTRLSTMEVTDPSIRYHHCGH